MTFQLVLKIMILQGRALGPITQGPHLQPALGEGTKPYSDLELFGKSGNVPPRRKLAKSGLVNKNVNIACSTYKDLLLYSP